MTFDNPQHQKFALELLNGAAIQGAVLEEALAFKRAVMTAKIAPPWVPEHVPQPEAEQKAA